MKKQILLVDEDGLVLKALKRSLRKFSDKWNILNANSSDEALSYLDQTAIDVLITEVHLAQSDGVLFLRTFLKRQPQASRIILTGYTNPNEIFKYAGLAHQLLAKPWEDQTLIETIQRADLVRNLLANDQLRKTLNLIESFPNIPEVYIELTDKLQSEESSVGDIGDIIIRDPSMTLKLLQIVNSPYYGLSMPVSDPKKAVALLGLDLVKGFVLTSGLFNQYEPRKVQHLSIETLWQHSLNTANIVKQIAKVEKVAKTVTETSFIASLLHDIGKIIIAVNFSESFQKAMNDLISEAIPVCQAEQQVLGASHAEIGAYLLCLWGLPLSIIRAVQNHHQPEVIDAPQLDETALLHIADGLENAMQNGEEAPSSQIDPVYIDHLGLKERVSYWQNLVKGLK